MTTYIEFHEDSTGDVVDLDYWHGFCAPAEVRSKGAWPCPEAIDYPVYCPGCERRVVDVPLTDAGLSFVCERGWDEAQDILDDWELRSAVDYGMVTDRFGRDWGVRAWSETCMECGQPDNCGDCNHQPLSDHQAVLLGAILPVTP